MSTTTTPGTRNFGVQLLPESGLAVSFFCAVLRLTPGLADLYLRRIRLVAALQHYDPVEQLGYRAPELCIYSVDDSTTAARAAEINTLNAELACQFAEPDNAIFDMDAAGITHIPEHSLRAGVMAPRLVVNGVFVQFTFLDLDTDVTYESDTFPHPWLEGVAGMAAPEERNA